MLAFDPIPRPLCRPFPVLPAPARRGPVLLERRGPDVGAVALCRHRVSRARLADLLQRQRVT